ncbi:MAG: hypothetical protein WB439_10060 [Acidobacteriaceae bacterium]
MFYSVILNAVKGPRILTVQPPLSPHRQCNETPTNTLLPNMLITNPQRAKHFAAMVLIGDGVMALIHPAADANAWDRGPKPWRNLMHGLAKRPTLTRAIGVAQILGGIYWALKQEDSD